MLDKRLTEFQPPFAALQFNSMHDVLYYGSQFSRGFNRELGFPLNPVSVTNFIDFQLQISPSEFALGYWPGFKAVSFLLLEQVLSMPQWQRAALLVGVLRVETLKAHCSAWSAGCRPFKTTYTWLGFHHNLQWPLVLLPSIPGLCAKQHRTLYVATQQRCAWILASATLRTSVIWWAETSVFNKV